MELTIICQMSNYFYHKMTVEFLFGHKSVSLDQETNKKHSLCKTFFSPLFISSFLLP